MAAPDKIRTLGAAEWMQELCRAYGARTMRESRQRDSSRPGALGMTALIRRRAETRLRPSPGLRRGKQAPARMK